MIEYCRGPHEQAVDVFVAAMQAVARGNTEVDGHHAQAALHAIGRRLDYLEGTLEGTALAGTEVPRLTFDSLIHYYENHVCHPESSWKEYDARGIYLCTVCAACEESKLAKYRPDVLTNANYEADEPIEPEG